MFPIATWPRGTPTLRWRASRINPSKEFFSAPVMTVVRAVDEAAMRWRIPAWAHREIGIPRTRADAASSRVSAVRREGQGALPAHRRPGEVRPVLGSFRGGCGCGRIVGGPGVEDRAVRDCGGRGALIEPAAYPPATSTRAT